jgi:acid phosphatase class B
VIFIFDIDGTVADCTHRIHLISGEHKDWDAFHDACDRDTPIQGTIQVLNALYVAGKRIVFVTGRMERGREKTEKWLETWTAVNSYDIRYNLVMRPNGNHEDDHVIKEKWLHNLPDRQRRDIVGVFEDRQRVVDMWRRNGLRCFQVAAGDY